MKPNADLLPEVLDFCRQNGLLPEGGRIIVGLSGGPDSLALLDLLHRMAPRHGFTVTAAHLNHGLRGAAADADEAAVRRLCADMGIRLYVEHRDIAAEAAACGQGPEEAGRHVRYAFFEAIARHEAMLAARTSESAAAAQSHAGSAGRHFGPEARHCLYQDPDVPAAAEATDQQAIEYPAGPADSLIVLPVQPVPDDEAIAPASHTPSMPPAPAGPAAAPALHSSLPESLPSSLSFNLRLSESEQSELLEAGIRIAVGHHRNDQAETVLLNLGRGSGIDGLAGMRPRNGLVIRPLLDIPRARIDAYVQWRGLEPCIDATNFETEATRNRLRHRVLPALNEAFGFDAVPALARAARLLRQDADCLQLQAVEALSQLRAQSGAAASRGQSGSGHPAAPDADLRLPDRILPGQVAALPVQAAAALHPAILSRVLRQWYRESFGDIRDLSESQVAGLAGLCQPGRSGRRCSLPHGRQALRDFDWLVLLTQPAPLAQPEPSAEGIGSTADASGSTEAVAGSAAVPAASETAVPASSAAMPAASEIAVPAASVEAAGSGSETAGVPLQVPGITEIPRGGYFVTQFIVDEVQIVYNYRIWCFPASELTGAAVRHRLPHDRIRSEGQAHGKSLKKLLYERQVPAGLRDRLPLIARSATVLWMPGVAAASRLPTGPDAAGIPEHQWVVVRYIRPEAAADGMAP